MNEQSLGKKITANVLWNFIGQGWLLILVLAATPYIIHHLNVTLYGIYALVSVVIDYFAFLQFGMGVASIKYIAQYVGESDEVKIRMTFWTGIGSHFIMGVLGTVVIFTSAPLLVNRFFSVPPHFRETALFALRIGSLGFLVSMLSGQTSGVIRAMGRFDILNFMGIIFGTLQTVSSVIILAVGWSLEEIVVCNISIQIAGLCGYWIYATRLLPMLVKPAWNRAILLHLLKFGSFVTVSGFVGPILMNIEKLFLTSLRSVSALTYYSVPFSFINRLSVIPSAFSQVLFPVFSFCQAADEGQVNRELHYRSTLYLSVIYSLPLFLCIFYGAPFLSWWLGKDFADNSAIILIILVIAGLINAVAYPSMAVLQGMGKPHLPAVFHVVETVLYVPAGYLFIKAFGGVGAAIAWFLRVFLDTLLLHHAACRLLGRSVIQWYGELFFHSLPPVLVLLVLFWSLHSLKLDMLHPFNMVGIVMIIAIYSSILWKSVLDDTARGRLKELLKRK